MRFCSPRYGNELVCAIIAFVMHGSTGLEEARKEFNAAIQGAQHQYNVTVQKAATKFKDVLRQGIDDETKASHLNEALALRTELTALDSSGLPLFAEHDQSVAELSAIVPGTWKIVYLPNHAKRLYSVKANGDVALADSNWKGRLQKMDGSLVLDVGDGKLERWSFAGGRLFVEHFAPKSDYPDNPAQIGVGEKGAGK